MLDDPYYSCAPTVQLERPVALAGFLGSRVPLTGALLSAMTGLPLVDLDRAVEHEAGRSTQRIDRELGLGSRVVLEGRVLSRVLRERPPPIIALGYDTLNDEGLLALLRAQSRLLYIERGFDELRGAMSVDTAAARRGHPADVSGLRRLHARCLGGYAESPEVVRGTGRHPSRVAAEVLSLLRG